MCVECGTALNVSNSPVANQERAFIREQIAAGQGQGADQGRAGRRVRRRTCSPSPRPSGFDLALWLVPGRARGARGRGRRRLRGAGAGAAHDARRQTAELPPSSDPDDARRLDAELAAFDR